MIQLSEQHMKRRFLHAGLVLADRHPEEAAVALINDDSTEVGYVHFGVVHVLSASSEAIVGRRSGILNPEFVPMAEAVKDASGYESWSAFCLAHLDSLLSKAAASGITVPERVIG